MESLRGIDDLVGRRAAALREEGALKNTYIVFSSDNGFQMYDNRVFSKGASYEDSHGVPLIVRGPVAAAGRTDGRLVANIDLAPTFADWAGPLTPSSVDGRSLVPVLSDPAPRGVRGCCSSTASATTPTTPLGRALTRSTSSTRARTRRSTTASKKTRTSSTGRLGRPRRRSSASSKP